MPDARQALQSRERAAMTAWAVYQRNVRKLSLMAICALAAAEPIRLDNGGYHFDAGLGKPLAKSTLHLWLSEARDQFRDEYIKRPILDMVMEEDDRLEHLAAEWAHEATRLPAGSPGRHNALDRYLRVLESRRKLLGLDQPQRVEISAEHVIHTDPATTALQAALQDAVKRREQAYTEIRTEEEIR